MECECCRGIGVGEFHGERRTKVTGDIVKRALHKAAATAACMRNTENDKRENTQQRHREMPSMSHRDHKRARGLMCMTCAVVALLVVVVAAGCVCPCRCCCVCGCSCCGCALLVVCVYHLSSNGWCDVDACDGVNQRVGHLLLRVGTSHAAQRGEPERRDETSLAAQHSATRCHTIRYDTIRYDTIMRCPVSHTRQGKRNVQQRKGVRKKDTSVRVVLVVVCVSHALVHLPTTQQHAHSFQHPSPNSQAAARHMTANDVVLDVVQALYVSSSCVKCCLQQAHASRQQIGDGSTRATATATATARASLACSAGGITNRVAQEQVAAACSPPLHI